MSHNFSLAKRQNIIQDFLDERLSKLDIRTKHGIGKKYLVKLLRNSGIPNKIRKIDGPRNYGARKYKLDFDYFKSLDREDKAYFLGLLSADGHIHQSKLRNFIHLSLIDLELIELFRDAIGSNSPVRSFQPKYGN